MRIDSHHHFWNYSPEGYPWIGGGMSVLKRDFSPADLKPLLDEASIGGVISVQARTDETENDFLLEDAAAQDWILGVVGWLDLAAPDAADKVARFAERPKAVGLREVLQGMTERDYCLRDDFNRGLAALHDFGLTYDLLIHADQLKAATGCVDQHPAQTFVLDHIGKPAIGGPGGVDPEWSSAIRELAKRGNVYCKLSGMITEVIPALEDWDPDLLGPWFDVVLDAFGPERLLFGSDWPVCLLRGEYADWVQCVEFWISGLSAAEQSAILGENAKRAYGLA
jgi:L-fuconolactonase